MNKKRNKCNNNYEGGSRMKKLFGLLLMFGMLVGCTSMMNTPVKKVEVFLNKYQMLDDDVVNQLDESLINEDKLTDSAREKYKDVMKKQYQNLVYSIKDETVDGDHASVEVEIEVIDFTKVMTDADEYLIANSDEFKDDNGAIDNDKFIDYKLDKMKDYKEKVKYTVKFTLTKVDKTWQLDEISEEVRQKIHGIYNYE